MVSAYTRRPREIKALWHILDQSETLKRLLVPSFLHFRNTMFLKTAALTTLLATSALGQTLTTLKDAREYATFMPYTPEQRTTVAETMDKLLSVLAWLTKDLRAHRVQGQALRRDRPPCL